MLLFAAPLRAFAQLDDPDFLGAVWRSVAWAVISLAGLVALLAWGGGALAEQAHSLGWLGHLLGWVLGGVGGAVLAVYFFLPLATVIASLYADRIAAAVERHFYPGLPPARPATFAEQTWDGIALGVRVLGWQVLILLIALIPLLTPIALPLGWLISAWSVGRGLFVTVAMRRLGRPAALACYRERRGAVVAQGALMALGSLVPVLNLFVPVLGTAAMVHVLMAGSERLPRR